MKPLPGLTVEALGILAALAQPDRMDPKAPARPIHGQFCRRGNLKRRHLFGPGSLNSTSAPLAVCGPVVNRHGRATAARWSRFYGQLAAVNTAVGHPAARRGRQ